ncbi:MAG: hypothetical protein JWQ81_5921 [Amycolatopsis sp.]|uniref:hypothetical protein n=1 Tax=Amycolatopsis sp. TaxID=37632 RepID=UPI00261E7F27|nr:hypothetical protein [Amycolatopsis sp.]MCU1685182.1 hypothetical protein [Amycolatopsis sp.]
MTTNTIAIIAGCLIAMAGVVVIAHRIKEKTEDTPTIARIGPIELSGGAGTVLAMIGGLILLASLLWPLGNISNRDQNPVSSTPTTPTRPSSIPPTVKLASPTPQVTQVAITSPTTGQKVIGKSGVLLEGTAGEADDRQLWLFDHADDNLYYLISNAPLTVTNGRWSAQDPQVGSTTSEDDGHTFVLLLAQADARCNGTLGSAVPNASGDIVFPHLPEGCSQVASVNVVKSSS